MSEINNNNIDKKVTCPEIVPEEQIGATDEERQWALKKEPRPPVPRSVFFAIAIIVLLAFVGGTFWYYRTNVLPEKYHQRATSLMKQEKYQEAGALYLKVLKLRPERKDVLYQIAYCLEMTGKKDEAVSRYEEHLKMMPHDVKALLRLGWLYMERGEYERALIVLRDAAKRDHKNLEVWSFMSKAGLSLKDRETSIEAFLKISQLQKEPQEVYAAARELMKLSAWEEAISAFDSFTKLAPEDKRGEHGAAAAKAMLGYPTDQKFVIVPGESLGVVRLGDSKEGLKNLLGRPDGKEFTQIGGKSLLAEKSAEIWSYNKSLPGRGIRVIFVSGKVKEIESSSPAYKTAIGLGLSNFMLTKNADKLKSRKKAENGTTLCLVKDGGLTFYAAKLNDEGTDAKYKKLRVHKGDASIDNINGFSSLLDLFE